MVPSILQLLMSSSLMHSLFLLGQMAVSHPLKANLVKLPGAEVLAVEAMTLLRGFRRQQMAKQ